MKFKTAFATVFLATAAAAAHAGMWMVFLNEGPTRSTDKEQMAKDQAEHIANLERLAKARFGMFAGPLADNGRVRGTVMVKAKDRTELMNHFKPDPFVSGNYLTVEAYPMDVALSQFHVPPRRKEKVLEQFTLALISRDRWLTKDLPRVDVLPSIPRWWNDQQVVMWGRLNESDSLIGVIMFANPNLDDVRQLLDNDPWVRDAKVRYELHPQMAIKDVLRVKPKAK